MKYAFPGMSNSDKLLMINELIPNERDRQINADWHLNGLTQEAIADKHHISRRRIQQIIRKSYETMTGWM